MLDLLDVHSSPSKMFRGTSAVAELLWENWEDVFIVFQATSAETHVFNQCTAIILDCLENDLLSSDMLKKRAESALGVGEGMLACDDFSFAIMRLKELRLIESMDGSCVLQ